MGVPRENRFGEVHGATIVSESSTSEILHYTDDPDNSNGSDTVNAGIYLISVKIYEEFEGEIHRITSSGNLMEPASA